MRIIIFVTLFLGITSKNLMIHLDKDARILDGFEVKISQAPYYVQILRKNQLIAGGSIISSLVILTAAHVFDSYIMNVPMSIIHSSDKSMQGEAINMETYFIHPEYKLLDRGENGYDVALFSLQKPLDFKRNLCAPVKLAEPGFNKFKVGDLVLVVGMGYESMFGLLSPNLLGINIPVVPDDVCKKFVISANVKWNPSIICLANTTIKGFDSCQGDSGGPAVFNNVQIGIVSWGYGCGKGLPGVYTRISGVYSWIMDTMKKIHSSRRSELLSKGLAAPGRYCPGCEHMNVITCK